MNKSIKKIKPSPIKINPNEEEPTFVDLYELKKQGLNATQRIDILKMWKQKEMYLLLGALAVK